MSDPAPGARLSTFRCPKAAEVELYTLVGATHVARRSAVESDGEKCAWR
jgi:hypothetical protein